MLYKQKYINNQILKQHINKNKNFKTLESAQYAIPEFFAAVDAGENLAAPTLLLVVLLNLILLQRLSTSIAVEHHHLVSPPSAAHTSNTVNFVKMYFTSQCSRLGGKVRFLRGNLMHTPRGSGFGDKVHFYRQLCNLCMYLIDCI